MKKILLSLALVFSSLFVISQPINAQVSVGVGIQSPMVDYGPAPVCHWGYFPYYPWDCSPEGFYDDSWFYEGIFIGAGPWFVWHPWYHRPREFYGGYFRAHPYTGRDGRRYGGNEKVDRHGNFHPDSHVRNFGAPGGKHAGGRPR